MFALTFLITYESALIKIQGLKSDFHLPKKLRLTSGFMTSQAGLQTIAVHILPDISQSKGNRTIRVSQLIEYNKRNIFLQKVCGK